MWARIPSRPLVRNAILALATTTASSYPERRVSDDAPGNLAATAKVPALGI